MSNVNCPYIFKRGQRKGKRCNKILCTKHTEESPSQPKIQIFTKLIKVPYSDQAQQAQQEDNVKKEVKEKDPIKYEILNLDTTTENKNFIIKHYNNIKKLDSTTSEYYKNQLFIEHSLSIPWNKYYNILDELEDSSTKDFINKIKVEFDKEIHGMDNIKNEIINYVCKFISNPSSTKNNIALYGSAGVCKTKFVKILSKILNIPVKIITLGGVKDSSYLLGHNYTYVEANYGIISQGIIQSKIMNPILYFDELDKVSEMNGGQDIYSILSNITDPTINNNFHDRYFGNLSFDLSKIFYIFTFNDINKINKVLLDRLNVIRIQNPTKQEKIVILEKHCLKDILSNIGIKKNIVFDNECYNYIIEYTDKRIDLKVSSGIRESVRILEKILLEINKEILLEKFPVKSNTLSIIFQDFKTYFEKLEQQFNSSDDNYTDNHSHMYI